MKKVIFLLSTFCAINCVALPAHATENEKLFFSPAPGISTTVTTQDQDVTLIIRKGANLTSETIHIDTEKRLNLISEDYNLDGHKDFSISHLDDGMGTYTIYQIYLFSEKDGKFIAAQPKCGDEFINIVFSRIRRTLTNSYFSENKVKSCTVKY